MKVNIEKKDGVVVFHVSGSLDAENVQQFKSQAVKIIEGGLFRFVLDFSNLEFVDSMGLGAMISLLRRVRPKKGDIKIASVNKDVMSIFEIRRLHRLFEIYPNTEHAANSFLRDGQ